MKKILFYLYFILLTWLLLREGGTENIVVPFPHADKISHVLSFLILSFLGRIVYPKVKTYILIILFIAFGVIVEILQEVMQLGRSFEYLDIVADAVGCILGYQISKIVIKKQPIN